MSYQLYRNTTLGHTLQESLDELIQVNIIILFTKEWRREKNCLWPLIFVLVWTNNAPIGMQSSSSVR